MVGLLNLVAPHLEITRQGLHERINEHAVVFFEKMLAWSISLKLPQRLSKEVQTLCPHFQRILILDSTSFQLPPTLARYFRGSGGGGSQAAVKILFAYMDAKGAFYLSRLRPDVKVYQCRNGEFEEFDLVHFAQKLRVSHAEIEV